jgi:pimeloyl-ACP methyl ester carboxylesterase
MKTKLLLSIILLGTLLQSNAQYITPAMKNRPADYEYLSAPDSLGVRHSLKMPNISSKNALITQTKLPYPIIFIHGLNSWSETWNTFTNYIDSTFGLSYGGRFDISLNDDNDLTSANLNLFPTVGADIAMYTSQVNFGADYYYVNFAVNIAGAVDETCANLSNQSAIAKQGLALREVIINVMQLTGRDKVILMGHSMGGLAAREYIQNPQNWVSTNVSHNVAKLVTTGTPHKGSNVNYPDLTWFTSSIPDKFSEAVRDLRTNYSFSLEPGVFLRSGLESQSVMNDVGLPGFNFYNFDVNCNGVIGETILGLNAKDPQYDLDYSCIIGSISDITVGDGVVTTESANLNTIYPNITQNIFNITANHLQLPSQSYKNLQGLDEPNDYNLAYGIDFGKNYMGFITQQSEEGSIDWDDYKFTISNTSNVGITIETSSTVNLNARIVASDYSQIGSIHSNNGTGNITFSQNNLPIGNYFLEIFEEPVSTSFSNYYFSLNKISTPVSPIVISQVYGGGGNANALYTNDYIELFNRGTVAQNLSGWSVQCTSATGPTTTWFPIILDDITLQPGQYYLIQGAGGANGVPFTADLISTASLSATAGKVILVSNTTPETSVNPTGSQILDKVGYGTTPNGYEGSGPTGTALTNSTAAFRKLNGCTDTNSNPNDFTVGQPNPRNSGSPVNTCSSLSVSQNTIETVTLYPNPTNSKVFFNNTNSNFKEVSIYNYLGQEVAKTSFTSTISNQEVDMTNLVDGLYVLKFNNGEGIISVKVIKQ